MPLMIREPGIVIENANQVYAEWQNGTGSPITLIQGTWTVPNPPANANSNMAPILFLWNGLGVPAAGTVIQPVLQWGQNSVLSWQIANYYVDSPNAIELVSSPVSVNPGDVVTGFVQLVSQVGLSFTYTSGWIGHAGINLTTTIKQQTTAVAASFEAYSASVGPLFDCSYLPNSNNTTFSNIIVHTTTSNTPSVFWTPNARITDCGQNIEIANNSTVVLGYGCVPVPVPDALSQKPPGGFVGNQPYTVSANVFTNSTSFQFCRFSYRDDTIGNLYSADMSVPTGSFGQVSYSFKTPSVIGSNAAIQLIGPSTYGGDSASSFLVEDFKLELGSTATTFVDSLGCPVPAVPALYPLRASANNRYLIGQNSSPFLVTGDASSSLIVNLSILDATTYLSTRQAQGFNVVSLALINGTYTGGRSDGSTYDGIVPFTTSMNFSTPNELYFQRADVMINLAAQFGFCVLLAPAETGFFLNVMRTNGAAKCRNYGAYLGNRYKSFNNIIWNHGNDYTFNNSDDILVTALAQGIRSSDPQHIHTVELISPRNSTDDPNWVPIIQLNSSYSYVPAYSTVLNGYNIGSPIPVVLAQSVYEGENNGQANLASPLTLRKQQYWSCLSGSTGQIYGNHYTWGFTFGWQSHLNSVGARQIINLVNLFGSRTWYNLVPDVSHTIVTSGYGSFSSTGFIDSNNYVTTARTSDGTLIISYLPSSSTIVVDMTKLSAPAIARWFDPTNGHYIGISGPPLANTGTHSFTSTGNNSAGDPDWVLVLETTPP